MTSFLSAVNRYMSLARVSDADVMRAAAYAPRDELLAALTNIPADTKGKSKMREWTSPARQLQRWKARFTGSAKQQRGKKQTIEKGRGIQRADLLKIPMIRRALLAKKFDAKIIVSGTVGASESKRVRTFTVAPVTYDHLNAIQIVARAARKAGEDPEWYALNCLTGIYFGSPPQEIVLGGEVVATAPYDATLDYEDDCTFTVSKLRR